MKKTVFLDLDGVIANWTKRTVESTFKLNYEDVTGFSREKFIPFITDRTGLTKTNINAKIYENDSVDFWTGIEKYYWADELVTLVNRNSYQWFFLTKPMRSPECYFGKAQWIKKYYPAFFHKLIITPGSKGLCARNLDCILIDDNLKNIEEWVEAGGASFPWLEVSSNPLKSSDVVKDRIEKIKIILS